MIEFALAILFGERSLINDRELKDVQKWSDWLGNDAYDCGYETTYRFKDGDLKITIHNRRTGRSIKCEAQASFLQSGSLTWKRVCELKGARIRSREEHMYREARDHWGPPNAFLFFHADERELLGMAIGRLQS